jgi:hypothetical protein
VVLAHAHHRRRAVQVQDVRGNWFDKITSL